MKSALGLMASSTSTGVFDMTRTTAASAASLDSMYLVVIPAATEITSWPAFTRGPTSSSNPDMSCGLTVMTRVSALPAASAAVVTSMP